MKPTTNYNQFRFWPTNRPTSPKNVKRLKESITKLGYITSRPIIVNQNFYILDGQNRFLACKEKELPIIYEIYHTRNAAHVDEVIAELNKNQSVWRLFDYIHHFAEQGITYHRTIREFEERLKLGISVSIIVCSVSDHDTSSVIRKGKNAPLNPKREQIAQFILDCKDLPFAKSTHFSRAIVKLFKFGKAEHIEKVRSNYMSIVQQPTTSAYMAIFQNMINKNKSEKTRVHFSA